MIKEDLEQEKFNKELEEKLKVNYPEFENKCDEVYKKCVNNKHKFFWNNKLLFMPCATIMLVIIMLITILDLPHNNIFTKLCDGVYVSASSLDLSGEVDMSICEGIKTEKRDDLVVILEEEHPGVFSNMWGYCHPLYFKFPEKNMKYIVYDNYFSYKDAGINNKYYDENDSRYIVWNKYENWGYLSQEEQKEILKNDKENYILIMIKNKKANIGYIILKTNLYMTNVCGEEVTWNITTKITVEKSIYFPKVDGKHQEITKEQIFMLYKNDIKNISNN